MKLGISNSRPSPTRGVAFAAGRCLVPPPRRCAGSAPVAVKCDTECWRREAERRKVGDGFLHDATDLQSWPRCWRWRKRRCCRPAPRSETSRSSRSAPSPARDSSVTSPLSAVTASAVMVSASRSFRMPVRARRLPRRADVRARQTRRSRRWRGTPPAAPTSSGGLAWLKWVPATRAGSTRYMNPRAMIPPGMIASDSQ